MNNNEEWKTAEVVFGRLIEINKKYPRIGIEIKEIHPETERWIWVPHYYKVSKDFSNEDYEELLNYLDRDIKVKLINGELTEILPT